MRPPVALAVLLLAAAPLAAQIVSIPLGGPRRERPSPNATLRGSPADIASAVASRGRPAAMISLDETRHPAEVLHFLGLPLGARVLDIAADSGYYSEIIGDAIGPNGKVTTLVEPATMKDPDRRRAMIELAGRAPNVALVAVEPTDAQFAANSFDFVLIHLAYHRFYAGAARAGADRSDAAALLAKIYAAVRPGGIVGVIDHAAAAGGEPRDVARRLGRIDPAVVRDDFRRAGFVLDGESGLLRLSGDDHRGPTTDPDIGATDRFVLRFIKPE